MKFLVKVVDAAEELQDTTRFKEKYVLHDRELAHQVLMNDYFLENSKYHIDTFRSHFDY